MNKGFVVAAVSAVMLGLASQAEAAPCKIVFVHGAGSQYAGQSYWHPSGSTNVAGNLAYKVATGAGSGGTSYPYSFYGYNGTVPWYTTSTISGLASHLNAITGCGDNSVIVVGHSMGGVVVRRLLNLGGYYQATGQTTNSYATAMRKVKYAITISSPHTGSPVADAAQGVHNSCTSGNILSCLIDLLLNNTAFLSLDRPEMEALSVNGTWMKDSYRTKKLYTVFSYAIGGTAQDGPLETAWALAGEGAAGDGLVDNWSGIGGFGRTRSFYAANATTQGGSQGPWTSVVQGQAIPGARSGYLKIAHNHGENRANTTGLQVYYYSGGLWVSLGSSVKLGDTIRTRMLDWTS